MKLLLKDFSVKSVNALIHRDYTIPTDIQVRIHEDRLEIWNAGELPPPLKPEDLHGPHSSVLRNPLLAQTFYFAGLVERWGTGTIRIIELCRAQALPPTIAFRNLLFTLSIMFVVYITHLISTGYPNMKLTK